MKNKFYLGKVSFGLTLFAALFLVACTNEDNPVIDPDSPYGEVQWTDVSGTTITNTKNIVIGDMVNDITYVRESIILSASGRTVEVMLECPAMAAIPLKDGYEDTLRTVENVTLINKGTITIHTKQIVEHFKNQIRTTDHPDRPYYYLRLLGLFGGKNSTLINDGLIDVYFDHDKNAPFTIYCFAMIGGDGSTIINNGTIRFHGNGSSRTRLRCVGTFGDYVTATNKGRMQAEVEMVEDSRMMTQGGNYSSFINDGEMIMRQPGRLMGITRYGDNQVVNNNLIDITGIDEPSWATSVVEPEDQCVCALFEPLNPTHQEMPELVNNGTINIKIESSEKTNPKKQGYGMFFDVMGPSHKVVDVINKGKITLSQTGPQHLNMAELGIVTRESMKSIASGSIRIKSWNTTLRDFSQTRDLFLGKGAKIDFTDGKLLLERADGYVDGTTYSVDPNALFYNADSNQSGFVYSYDGYEGLTIEAAAPDKQTLNWDKTNKVVSLTNK